MKNETVTNKKIITSEVAIRFEVYFKIFIRLIGSFCCELLN
jgi:hypothetical protein